jgi:NAD(P)-dependent dehydrogenase (short-subunit alcohol dehydrogenase family)
MQDLQGKVALISGGTTGIGLAAAKAFIACGARVVIASRNAERGAEAERELRQFGGEGVFKRCDVTDLAAVAELVAFVQARFGQLHCAVNSAACDSQAAALHEVAFEDMGATIATDVVGVFNCMKVQIGSMLKHGGGTIVNIASVNGLSGAATASVYSAAKHAVIGLTRSAATEYIGSGIRINSVCPGATQTPRRERRMAHLSAEEQAQAREQLARAIPIGRLAKAEEIASAILWLSSSASSYVVGHSLVVDGGLCA